VTTAIIGVGNIGKALARDLVNGGEPVVLAASSVPVATASELGNLATATTVPAAIEQADVVVLAVWLDVIKQLISEHRSRLEGKVVIDPSNPVAVDAQGRFTRTLPERVSAGSVVASLVPRSTHYAKAFGTVSAGSLASGANRTPKRAVLFYATDDDKAASVVERLIVAAGFDPVRAGGVDQAIRIEMFGDLHDFGGLNGRLITVEEARTLLAGPST
jgi:8-hydroxy-5-deazaflavin:NADPH oxidoreductase